MRPNKLIVFAKSINRFQFESVGTNNYLMTEISSPNIYSRIILVMTIFEDQSNPTAGLKSLNTMIRALW